VVNGNRDDLVRIPEANRPETGCDSYNEIVQNRQRQIADIIKAGIVDQLEVNSSRDSSRHLRTRNCTDFTATDCGSKEA
jgi:hypothetical protein